MPQNAALDHAGLQLPYCYLDHKNPKNHREGYCSKIQCHLLKCIALWCKGGLGREADDMRYLAEEGNELPVHKDSKNT